MSERSFITALLDEIHQFLSPLRAIAHAQDPLIETRRLLSGCGWHVTADVDISPLVDLIADVESTLHNLRADPIPSTLGEVHELLDEVTGMIESVRGLVDSVGALGSAGPVSGTALTAFGEDVIHHLTISWLERTGSIADIVSLAGGLTLVDVAEADLGWLHRDAGERGRVDLRVLGLAVEDPAGHLLAQLAPGGWSTSDDAAATNVVLSRTLGGLLARFGGSYRLHPDLLRSGDAVGDLGREAALELHLPGVLGLQPSVGADVTFVSPADEAESGAPGPVVEIRPYGVLDGSLPVGDATVETTLAVTSGGTADTTAPVIEVGPGGVSVAGDVALDAAVTADIPVDLVLGSEATGLVVGRVTLRGFAVVGPEPDFGFAVGIEDASLNLDSADLGAVVDSLLHFEAAVPFDLVLEWSHLGGLRLSGNASLEVLLPVTISLGGVAEIDGIKLTVELGETVRLELTGSVALDLGPVALTVDGLGFSAALEPRSDGNLGAAHLGLDVLPPTGVGLALDLGVVGGGGYISIDSEAGRYEGVIDLDVLGIGLAAVVVVDTDVPGTEAWSVLFAIFLDLPSLQLGFGFTLEGVGGMAGINRTIDQPALEQAVRSGSLDTVLFPEDPVANAPAVIDTFAAIFPPAAGRYVFGPVVQIGWGTPTLIEARLGVVIELPDPIRIALLGSMSAVLPSPDLELMAFRLDVAGLIDFGAATLALDASLHDSHVIGFAISGDMALRADLGGRPSFLLSLGGFHPGFTPPSGFPALDRLSMGLTAGTILELSFECYFAITSNTVQFGGAFGFWAEVAGFGVEGGTEFDALLQFTPFRVKTHIGMYVAITAVGVDLAGVWLNADLEGPNPWHVVGTAEFKVLGIKEEIRVDERIGSAESEPDVLAPDLLAELVTALDNDDAWEVSAPAGRSVVLSDDLDAAAVAPDGTLSVEQALVPLDTRIEKFGEATDLDHVELRVTAAPGFAASGVVTDWFAPNQFFDLRRGDQLSAPSFEQHPSGLSFGGGTEAGTARQITLTHEVSKLDPELDALNRTSTKWPDGYHAIADARRVLIDAGVTAETEKVLVPTPVFDVDEPAFSVIDPLTGAILIGDASFSTAWGTSRDAGVLVRGAEVEAL